jgi:hypothetical protein
MIRAFAIAAALVCLAACAEGAEGNAWYQQGDANYDAIKAADDACKAKGGTFQLKKDGDPTHLGDFECVMPKGQS